MSRISPISSYNNISFTPSSQESSTSARRIVEIQKYSGTTLSIKKIAVAILSAQVCLVSTTLLIKIIFRIYK